MAQANRRTISNLTMDRPQGAIHSSQATVPPGCTFVGR